MNYRHAYHAGNFADVVKHVVVTRIVEYLKRKDKPFRVIDTHAGAGVYDLSSEAARKTGEWRAGIGRLIDAGLPADAAALITPYLGAVLAQNEGGLERYPGSPLVVRHLLRRTDRLTAIEKHPDDAETLKARFAGDWQARIIELDGWLALGAHLPPKEKRGLVLIDPPFEEDGEFDRLLTGLATAHRRWPGGIYALWYPIKHHTEVEAFRSGLERSGIPDIVDIALSLRSRGADPRLVGSGMVVVNPPYPLAAEMRTILPSLSRLLAEGGEGAWSVRTLAPERSAGRLIGQLDA